MAIILLLSMPGMAFFFIALALSVLAEVAGNRRTSKLED